MCRQALALLLLAVLLPVVHAAAAEDHPAPPEPVGVWRAELAQGDATRGPPLQVTLRIRQGRDGLLTASFEGFSPSLPSLKAENLILVEDVLSFQVPQVDGRFAGNFYGDSLRGTWTQGEQSRSLIFYRD